MNKSICLKFAFTVYGFVLLFCSLLNAQVDASSTVSVEHDNSEIVSSRVRILCPLASSEQREVIRNIAIEVFAVNRVPQWQWSDYIVRLDEQYRRILANWNESLSLAPELQLQYAGSKEMLVSGKFKNASEQLGNIIEQLTKAHANNAENINQENQAVVAELSYLRGIIADMLAEYQESEKYLCSAVDIVTKYDNALLRVRFQTTLGKLYFYQKEYSRAEAVLEPALSRGRELLSKGSELAEIILALGELYADTDRLLPANKLFTEALEMKEAVTADNDPELLHYITRLASSCGRLDMDKRAGELLLRASELGYSRLGASHPTIGLILGWQASRLAAEENFSKANIMVLQSLAIFKNALGETHPDTTSAMLFQSYLLMYLGGRPEDSIKLIEDALAIDVKSHGEKHYTYSRDMIHLGMVKAFAGDYDEAEVCLAKAMEVERLGPDFDDFDESWCMYFWGYIYNKTGRYDKAEQSYLRAFELDEAKYGTGYTQSASHLLSLAEVYKAQDKAEKVKDCYERALNIYRNYEKINGKKFFWYDNIERDYQEYVREAFALPEF